LEVEAEEAEVEEAEAEVETEAETAAVAKVGEAAAAVMEWPSATCPSTANPWTGRRLADAEPQSAIDMAEPDVLV
jgi:hypothetical protein